MDVMLRFMIYFFLASSVVGMVRTLIGPTVVDRMIGLNIVASQILALLVLVAVSEARSVYLDVALVYDIFGFVGILAIARYVDTKEVNG
ncbi:MAG: pH regulation protein F [Spirochaetes bacterium]|jgi:multicomponent Na+:H+ antiporter subunit F|nr:pH regulation protein F [Spirochaetota bacterium]